MISLLNADCRAVLPKLPDQSFDMIFLDPPWGESNHEWDVPVVGWGREIRRLLKPSGTIWVMTSMGHFLRHMHAEINAGLFRYVQDVVIEHPNGNGPTLRPEFRKVHHHAIQFRMNGHSRNLLTQNRPKDGARMVRSVLPNQDPKRRWHPAQQPINVVSELIAQSTNPGDCILDPFAGSATSAIAAFILDRDCVCIEKNYPIYTQAEARLIEAGVPYNTPLVVGLNRVEDQAQRPQRNPEPQPTTGGPRGAIPDPPRVQRNRGIRGRLRSQPKA